MCPEAGRRPWADDRVKLLTCSYRAFRPAPGRVPVAASLGLPRDMPEAADWARCWLLTPRGWYFRKSAAEYDAAFVAQMQRAGVAKIARVLHQIGREHDAAELVICCWEPTPNPVCHRGLWAEFWLRETGEVVEELT